MLSSWGFLHDRGKLANQILMGQIGREDGTHFRGCMANIDHDHGRASLHRPGSQHGSLDSKPQPHRERKVVPVFEYSNPCW